MLNYIIDLCDITHHLGICIYRQMSRQRFSLHSLYAVCFSDELDAYIVVSFVNATLVLSIGDTVEEVMDSGFVGTTPTLSASAVGDDALLQVRELATFGYFFRCSLSVGFTSLFYLPRVHIFVHSVSEGHAIVNPM